MNEPTLADVVGVYARKPDDFAPSVKLSVLRAAAKDLEVADEWRLQCVRLVAECASLRARIPA